MNERKVLITGCSTGIGRAAAIEFAKRGYQVIATVRSAAGLEPFPVDGVRLMELDLACSAQVEARMLELAAEGLPQYVIHNAGFGMYGALEDLPRAALEEQFAANVLGAHQITRWVLPFMRKCGHGRIVFVSSILGVVAMRGRGAYVASKFAIEGMADTLRLELAGSGIDVSLIEPGPIETSFRANAHKALLRNVETESSVHREFYRAFVRALAAPRSQNRFAQPAQACVPALIHALESRTPKARYRITAPTRLFSVLKRIIPTRSLDRILIRG